QGGVGADGHERPAFGQAARGGGPVGDEQAAGLTVRLAGRLDLVDGLDERRRGHVAGHAEVVAEVAGTDEEHVDSVQSGDLVGVADGGHRLDLDYAEDLGVGAVERARVEPEPAGPVVGGDAAVTGGRVAQVPDGLGHL